MDCRADGEDAAELDLVVSFSPSRALRAQSGKRTPNPAPASSGPSSRRNRSAPAVSSATRPGPPRPVPPRARGTAGPPRRDPPGVPRPGRCHRPASRRPPRPRHRPRTASGSDPPRTGARTRPATRAGAVAALARPSGLRSGRLAPGGSRCGPGRPGAWRGPATLPEPRPGTAPRPRPAVRSTSTRASGTGQSGHGPVRPTDASRTYGPGAAGRSGACSAARAAASAKAVQRLGQHGPAVAWAARPRGTAAAWPRRVHGRAGRPRRQAPGASGRRNPRLRRRGRAARGRGSRGRRRTARHGQVGQRRARQQIADGLGGAAEHRERRRGGRWLEDQRRHRPGGPGRASPRAARGLFR